MNENSTKTTTMPASFQVSREQSSIYLKIFYMLLFILTIIVTILNFYIYSKLGSDLTNLSGNDATNVQKARTFYLWGGILFMFGAIISLIGFLLEFTEKHLLSGIVLMLGTLLILASLFFGGILSVVGLVRLSCISKFSAIKSTYVLSQWSVGLSLSVSGLAIFIIALKEAWDQDIFKKATSELIQKKSAVKESLKLSLLPPLETSLKTQ